MCHLNARGMTPTNTGGACGLNASLRSCLYGPFFTSARDVHTRLCVYKHPWPQVAIDHIATHATNLQSLSVGADLDQVAENRLGSEENGIRVTVDDRLW
jgi:hypothetical protein